MRLDSEAWSFACFDLEGSDSGDQVMNFSANLLRYTEQVRHGTETASWVRGFVHG